jgi:hypothetical protein
MNLPMVFQPEVREEIDEGDAWNEGRRTGLGEEFLIARIEIVAIHHSKRDPKRWQSRIQ